MSDRGLDPRNRFHDLDESLRRIIEAALLHHQGAWPVRIEKHDTKQNTVNATPTIKLKWVKSDGSEEWVQQPTAGDLPLYYPGGGGASITFPVKQGNTGLMVVADRTIDKWWQQGGIQEQTDARIHDMSDGFVFPGFHSQPDALPNVSENTMQIRTKDGKANFDFNPDAKGDGTGEGQMTMTAPDHPTSVNGKGFNTDVQDSNQKASNQITLDTPLVTATKDIKALGKIDSSVGFFKNGVAVGGGTTYQAGPGIAIDTGTTPATISTVVPYLPLTGGTLSGGLAVYGGVTTYGPLGSYYFYDRSDQSKYWVWYSDTGYARLWCGINIQPIVIEYATGVVTFANANGQFLLVNTTAGSTNINKYFRVSPVGTLEITNSAYTAVIFQFTDAGRFTPTSNITLLNSVAYQANNASGAAVNLLYLDSNNNAILPYGNYIQSNGGFVFALNTILRNGFFHYGFNTALTPYPMLGVGTDDRLKVNGSALGVDASGPWNFYDRIVIPNNTAYQAKNASGNPVNLLYLNSSNTAILPYGVYIDLSGQIWSNGAVVIPNTYFYFAKDSAGAAQPVIGMLSSNRFSINPSGFGVDAYGFWKFNAAINVGAAGISFTIGSAAHTFAFDWNGNLIAYVDGTNVGTVAFGGSYLPLTGGTVTGTLVVANASGGYGGQFNLTNSSPGATNPTKYFRVSPTGTLEIVNSAFTAVEFQFTDTGDFNATGRIYANATIFNLNSGNATGAFHMAPNLSGTAYGSFWYNDGTNTYLLLTNNNDALGTYNGLRPFNVNNATGIVTMGHGLNLNGVLQLAGGSPFASQDANYNIIYDKAGNQGILLGNGANTDPSNYYRNSTHRFQGIGGAAGTSILLPNGAPYMALNASGAPVNLLYLDSANNAFLAYNNYIGTDGNLWCSCNVIIRNNQYFYVRDTVGTPQPVLGAGADNRLKINSAGFNVDTGGGWTFGGAVTINGGFIVNNSISSLGASAFLQFADRSAGYNWAWYGSGGLVRLWQSNVGDVGPFFDSAGNVFVRNAQGYFGYSNDGNTRQLAAIDGNNNSVFAAGAISHTYIYTIAGGYSVYLPQSYLILNNYNAYKPGAGMWADVSERQYKEDIADYTAGLSVITRLRPRSYKYNDRGLFTRDGRTHRGFIYDEVEDIMPEMTGVYRHRDSEGNVQREYKTLDASSLIYALVNAVKELAAEVDALKAA